MSPKYDYCKHGKHDDGVTPIDYTEADVASLKLLKDSEMFAHDGRIDKRRFECPICAGSFNYYRVKGKPGVMRVVPHFAPGTAPKFERTASTPRVAAVPTPESIASTLRQSVIALTAQAKVKSNAITALIVSMIAALDPEALNAILQYINDNSLVHVDDTDKVALAKEEVAAINEQIANLEKMIATLTPPKVEEQAG